MRNEDPIIRWCVRIAIACYSTAALLYAAHFAQPTGIDQRR